jgi:hypothetical protein
MFLANKLNKGSGSAAPDAQFNYVTMLLHGDGTNGAQNNTFVDSSTNNFSITRNGNTTQGSFSPYGSNWSNYFNGSTDYVTFPSNAAFNLGSGDFTIEMWIFKTVTGSQQFLAQLTGSPSAINQSIGIGTFNDQVGFDVAVGSTYYGVTTASSLVLNTWNHIACVRNGSTLTVFINGTSAGTISVTGSVNSISAPMTVGRLGNYNGYYTTGYISNLRIVKGTAVYTSNFTPSTTPLTAISGTSLLTCQSNRFIDTSSNAFTATANGTPSVQRFNPFGTATAYSTSVIGGSGYFDGSDDLSFPNNTAFVFGTGSFTIEFWINGPLNNDKFILGGRDAIGGMHITTGGSSSTAGVLRYVGTSTIVSSNVITDNSWHHCAIVRNGSSNITLYVDGVSVGTGTDTNNYAAASGTWYIARNDLGGSNYLTGYLSNLRIVKGTAVYTSGFTPPTAPLTAISGTSLLLLTANAAIFDNAMMNDLETVGNAQISTSVKKYGTGSLAFDGTGDYLQIPYSPNFQFGTGAYTVEFWINTTATSVWIMFNAATDTGIRLFIDSAGKIQLNEQVSNADNTQTSTSAINNGAWRHVALSRASGQGTKIFIDGVSEAQQSSVNNFSNTSTLYIGTRSSLVLFFNGYLDDLRITNGFARYTTTFTPPTAAFSNTGPV